MLSAYTLQFCRNPCGRTKEEVEKLEKKIYEKS